MLVTKKIERFYIVEMTEQQKDDVVKFLSDFAKSDVSGITQGFDSDTFPAVSDLRESLLNA